VRAGGVIAYPTEGVFGLGCNPESYGAVHRILMMKKRPESAGLILIGASLAQLESWIDPTNVERDRLIANSEDAITWVVTASEFAPQWITGGRPTIAVRVTKHPIAAGLCIAAGMPLVSTSANRGGRPPANNAMAARRRFGGDVDCVVAGATGDRDVPTEIRIAATGKVLRSA
jgi:L-threonylcarbamoyladenylate synthase